MLSHAECQAREQSSAGAYQPRDPEQSLVYRVLQENLETFLARQQDNGRYVPRFVERELRTGAASKADVIAKFDQQRLSQSRRILDFECLRKRVI